MTHDQHKANIARILAELEAAHNALVRDGYADSVEFQEEASFNRPDAPIDDCFDDIVIATWHLQEWLELNTEEDDETDA